MALREFDTIRRFFAGHAHGRSDVVLGSGDDCALLKPPEGQLLASTVDTLVEGVHFFSNTDPEALGYKAMAVSISDLAAMGAEPAWAVATLSIPSLEDRWCEAFARGIFQALDSFKVALVGGDLVRGPLTITTALTGFVPEGQALRRSGAQAGDLVIVTGTLGDAAMAVWQTQQQQTPTPDFLARLLRPTPRVATGLALRALASSAIDISDGLLGDLGHILESCAHPLGAHIELTQLPLSDALREYAAQDRQRAYQCALGGGDDYELCATLPAVHLKQARALSPDPLTVIGTITDQSGIRCTDRGEEIQWPVSGYQHFDN